MRRHGLLVAVWVLCVLLFTGHRDAQAQTEAGRTGVFIHEVSSSGDRVFVYELTRRHRLRRIPGSPFVAAPTATPIAIGFDARTVAYSRRDSMLFTAGNNGITAWNVGRNLRLQRVQGSPFGGGTILNVAVAQKGERTFVYGAAGFPDKGLRGFELQPDGTLDEVPGSPFEPTGGSFTAPRVVGDLLVVVKAGEFVINQNGALATFLIQNDGSLTAGPRLAYDPDAFHPFTARNGACVFLPEINLRRLRTYEMDPATGALAEAPGSPAPINQELAGTPGSATLIGMVTRGDLAFLFTARTAGGPGKLRAFRVQPDCSLDPLGDIQTIGEVVPTLAAVNGEFPSFVVADSGRVRAFRFNSSTGRLTRRSTRKVGASNVNGITIGRRDRTASVKVADEDDE